MKKIFALLLALSLIVSAVAFAETENTEPEYYSIEGIVSEVTGAYAIIETVEFGTVQVNLTADTVFTSELPLIAGQYTFITYNGQMTRSIPAQISAIAIGTHRLLGEITSIDQEQGFFMMNTALHGEIIVHYYDALPIEAFSAGDLVMVYHNGAMMLSLPAQINTGHVLQMNELTGSVIEIHEDYLVIETADGEYQINLNAATEIDGEIEPTAMVTVLTDGKVSRSLPPQVSAYGISVAAVATAMEAAE